MNFISLFERMLKLQQTNFQLEIQIRNSFPSLFTSLLARLAFIADFDPLFFLHRLMEICWNWCCIDAEYFRIFPYFIEFLRISDCLFDCKNMLQKYADGLTRYGFVWMTLTAPKKLGPDSLVRRLPTCRIFIIKQIKKPTISLPSSSSMACCKFEKIETQNVALLSTLIRLFASREKFFSSSSRKLLCVFYINPSFDLCVVVRQNDVSIVVFLVIEKICKRKKKMSRERRASERKSSNCNLWSSQPSSKISLSFFRLIPSVDCRTESIHSSPMLFDGTLIRVLIKFTVVQLITVALHLFPINISLYGKNKLFPCTGAARQSIESNLAKSDRRKIVFCQALSRSLKQCAACRWMGRWISEIHIAIGADKSLSSIHLHWSLISALAFDTYMQACARTETHKQMWQPLLTMRSNGHNLTGECGGKKGSKNPQKSLARVRRDFI